MSTSIPNTSIYPTYTMPTAQFYQNQIQQLQNAARGLTPNQTPLSLPKVHGIESARNFAAANQLVPNSMVAVFEDDDDIMYIIKTDASNYPTIRRFRFVEEPDPSTIKAEEKYVTLDEFNKFKEEVLSNAKQFVRPNDNKQRNHNNSSNG